MGYENCGIYVHLLTIDHIWSIFYGTVRKGLSLWILRFFSEHSRPAELQNRDKGCASARKFANICEVESEICEFDLKNYYIFIFKMCFFLPVLIVTTHVLIWLQICEFLLVICENIWRSACRGCCVPTGRECSEIQVRLKIPTACLHWLGVGASILGLLECIVTVE